MKKTLSLIRLILYITLFTTFFVWSIDAIESESLCFTYTQYGVVCPTCGVTRAFANILHFRFARAYAYNPLFTIAIAPISLAVISQDAYIIIKRLLNKNIQDSLLEYFFVGFFT